MLEGKGGNNAAASGSEGIDALPNEVLERILGLLPATEAVRTCVLARRWRHLWKSATGLRVRCVVDPVDYWKWEEDLVSLQARQGIVDQILRLREGAFLDTFEVVFCNVDSHEHMVCLNRWLQHVIMCQVRTIKIQNLLRDDGWIAEQPLVSRFLTRLEVAGVPVESSFIDFSGCPYLEHLDIVNCLFTSIHYGATNITSESLKHLTVRNCFWGSSTLVRVPNLVSLQLDGHFHEPPVFHSMPILQEAFVRIAPQERGHIYYEGSDCLEDCYTCGVDMHEMSKYGLLKCLSEAESLALISGPEKFVFHKALVECPTFSKLKSLLLNDSWCVVPTTWLEPECPPPYYFHAIARILKRSPVLQKLCILFSKGPEHKLVIKGRPNTTDLSTAISGNLKIVEVKCEVADKRVFQALKFLGTFGISFNLEDAEILE